LIILFNFLIQIQKEEREEGECTRDEQCVKQQVTCCSCNMGGEEKCMTKQEVGEWQEKLARECKENRLCTALYNCKDTSCKCVEGRCIEE
jgi:hypothetical protein